VISIVISIAISRRSDAFPCTWSLGPDLASRNQPRTGVVRARGGEGRGGEGRGQRSRRCSKSKSTIDMAALAGRVDGRQVRSTSCYGADLIAWSVHPLPLRRWHRGSLPPARSLPTGLKCSRSAPFSLTELTQIDVSTACMCQIMSACNYWMRRRSRLDKSSNQCSPGPRSGRDGGATAVFHPLRSLSRNPFSIPLDSTTDATPTPRSNPGIRLSWTIP
jgi:hypothetical protein